MPKKKECLCDGCRATRRASAGLRICECRAEMSYGEKACCATCAKKKGICQWCGAKLPAPPTKGRRK
jgi:hypothetical protein